MPTSRSISTPRPKSARGGARPIRRTRPDRTRSAEVGTALAARDEIDRTRTASPLYAAADAIVVDTTGKTIDEVVDEVMA